MAVTFFYGMSGTFKTTTVNSILNSGQDCVAVKSMIKTWKDLEQGIFNGLIDYNDLNYALLHLCILKHEIDKKAAENILVERGVSDMFYFMLRNNPGLDIKNEVIQNAVRKEEELCKDLGVKKLLLVQKDIEFIENDVLKDPIRQATFPGGLDQYLKNQKDYVDFTKMFNSSVLVIEIKDAYKYLSELGK
jgi:hypothetical protein